MAGPTCSFCRADPVVYAFPLPSRPRACTLHKDDLERIYPGALLTEWDPEWLDPNQMLPPSLRDGKGPERRAAMVARQKRLFAMRKQKG